MLLKELIIFIVCREVQSIEPADDSITSTAAPVEQVPVGFGTVDAFDWSVVISSLLATLGLGLWTAKQASGKSADYFVGSRAIGWQVVGASMFASNIGTEHFIGQAGSAAAGGMGVGLYEWLSVYLLFALAYFFSPFYLRIGITTIPEYIQNRYGTALRLMVTVICLAAYVLTKLSATLFTGVILVEVLYGGEVNVFLVALVLVMITASYTVAGGLKAVMITDAFQMVIFVIGGFAGLLISLRRVGFDEMRATLPPQFFHVVRPSGEYAWHAMFLGQPLGSCWYWCIDQFIVQRVLAAKNLRHAQSGCLFASAMKFLPPYLLCIPGMAARTLFEKCRLAPTASDRWCETGLDDAEQANKAYPLLVVLEFPSGLRGLIIAAMFMSMLSSLSSVYNSAATLITMDIYKAHVNPASTEKQLVMVGRAASLLMTVLTFAWFPVMTGQHGLLYLFVQMVSMHVFPSLVVVFLLGMLTTRVNAKGALIGLVSGAVLGIIQMVVSLAFADAAACQGKYFKWECLHFNHFAIFLAFFVAIVSVLSSFLFPPPSPEKLLGQTVWSVQTTTTQPGRKYEDFKDVDEACGGEVSAPNGSSSQECRSQPVEKSVVAVIGHSSFSSQSLPNEGSATDATATDFGPHPSDGGDWNRHDSINLAVTALLFVLMAVNLWAWS